jgi:type I restriction enzyme S subunit
MITSMGGFVAQSDKYSRFMAGESLKNYVELHRGEFAYNKGNSRTYPQGCIFRLDGWEKAAVPSVYISFALKGGRLHSAFASQFFGAGGLNWQLKRVITSGARSNGLLNLSVDDFFDCRVPLPPLPEQKKIAAILSSVDEAIQATEAVIEQTRRVKEGLLQDLLTRGIGHKRFKQTEIGEIPEGWEVRRLGECFTDTGDGNYSAQYPKQADFMPTGVPFITPSDIGDYTVRTDSLRYIGTDQHERLQKGHLKSDDILLVTRGNTGQLAEVPERLVGSNINAQLVRLGVAGSCYIPGFALVVLDSPMAQGQFNQGQSGSALRQLPWRHLNGVLLPVPSVQEQRTIRLIFDELRDATQNGRAALAKLAQVKAGLLQDLLTGKVRVSA